MARPKVPVQKGPGRRPSRKTVKALPDAQVQPGAVAAGLGPGLEGIPIEQDLIGEKSDLKDEQIRKRDAFLARARTRWKMSADAESELRRAMLEDLEFYNSKQWPDEIVMARRLDKRPCLTINRLPQFVRQVVNQARQSKPAIQINPVDNGSDPDTAEVLQGICRHIEIHSRAQVAYSKANEDQAIMGRGWWRVLAEYAADDSFEQEIRIKRIMDPFTVYPDPACGEPDYSDGTFCFIVERLPKDEYQIRYPKSEISSLAEFQSVGDMQPLWMGSDWVQVAEYFYIDTVKRRIADVVMFAGTEQEVRVTLPREAIKDVDTKASVDEATGEVIPPKVTIIKERDSMTRTVKWALINGCEVLEGSKDLTEGRALPGRFIPIVPALGEELSVDGKRNLRGMVRDARSPQTAYNFWVSAMTEKLALGTKAPVIAAAGQLEGHETKWNQSNVRNYAFLEYNPIELNGNLVPAPQRAGYDPDVSAALLLTQQADRDLKSVIGMFDASQERSQEQSGKAIIARQQQGENGTSHFLDNLSRSIEHTGRILLDWIPVYYDKPRMLRIMGLDEQPRDVVIHADQPEAAMDLLEGVDGKLRGSIFGGKPFDLAVGRYDVSVSVGPSYQSRRQESVEALIQLVQAYPSLLPVCGDILTKNMDWPGARELSERLKRMVPPEAKDPEAGQAEIPPEIQQQMQQMQQELEAAMMALAEKDEIIQTKQVEQQGKIQVEQLRSAADERLERLRMEHETRIEEAKLAADAKLALLEAKLQEISQRLEHAHEEKMEARHHQFEQVNHAHERALLQGKGAQAAQLAAAKSPAAPMGGNGKQKPSHGHTGAKHVLGHQHNGHRPPQ